jgi:hypothetical protein
MTVRFHFTVVKWQSSRKQITNATKDVGEKEPLCSVGGVEILSHYGDQYEVPQKTKNTTTT